MRKIIFTLVLTLLTITFSQSEAATNKIDSGGVYTCQSDNSGNSCNQYKKVTNVIFPKTQLAELRQCGNNWAMVDCQNSWACCAHGGYCSSAGFPVCNN